MISLSPNLEAKLKITGEYSHKGGKDYIVERHSSELDEVIASIEQMDSLEALAKKSSEKTKPPLLFSPIVMNQQIKNYLHPLGWTEHSSGKKGFSEPRVYFEGNQFREMDGIKNKVGLEIQFGKYAFMGYDIFSKMPIFAKKGLITCGIEVVVMPSMVKNMSTGVSSFIQIKTDMEARGVADIDIPTLILGFECSEEEWVLVQEKREAFKRNPGAISLKSLSGTKPGPK